jgi:hypothetical protein
MALSKSVEDSLREAESSLRNALAYAARQEKPFIAKHIADMIHSIDNLISADAILDKLENRESGDSGFFGTTFDFDN